MTENQNESAFEQTLHQMLNDRMQIARDLADTAGELERQRERLANVEGSYRAAYDLALSNGWTNVDLSKIGLPTPAPKPRVRARRKPKNDTPRPQTDDS